MSITCLLLALLLATGVVYGRPPVKGNAANNYEFDTTAKKILGRWCSEEDNSLYMTVFEHVIVYHSDEKNELDLVVSYTFSRRSCDTRYMRQEGDGWTDFLATSEDLCWEVLGVSDTHLSLQYTANAKRHLYVRCEPEHD